MKCSIRNILLLLFTIISLIWFECAMYAALHLSWYRQPWFYAYRPGNDIGVAISWLLIVFPALLAFLLFRLIVWAIFRPDFKYLWSALIAIALAMLIFHAEHRGATFEFLAGLLLIALFFAAPYWDFSTMRNYHRRAVSTPKK